MDMWRGLVRAMCEVLKKQTDIVFRNRHAEMPFPVQTINYCDTNKEGSPERP